MIISIYSASTGEFKATQSFPDDLFDDVIAQIEEGDAYITGEYSSDTHRVVGDEVIAKPPKPFLGASWDSASATWIDDRIPNQEADDAQRIYETALLQIRADAHLTKLQFVMAVVNAEIISQASGLDLLDGKIPVELDGMTTGMSDMEKFELSAKLKGAQQIDRTDPWIIAAGTFLGLSDEAMDAVFNINTNEI